MKRQCHLKSVKRFTKKEDADVKDHFKTVARHVTTSAASVLDETWAIWEIDPSSKELREKFSLLEYYLDYLKRLCEE
ncbi:MAG: hypothetical protein AB1847_14310 [bacterium]